ncbi:cytochrome b/b6 domain-containing protein [Phenylobacterium sp.]|uniref:cytochrome b/b6 domain-containing protein n=1 Tax=Phenylobacterium sp. TaxID=1871053 RepID=UPI0019AE0D1C|nr:cytochrome b/b6 domain-containing protein [Phenylobacterium sp.]MBC7169085.1 cytochrome b/b6 domain-containing protein [Phenylobacterium sp.]
MQIAQHRRWDPLVQLTHWGVAAGVLANGVFTDEGSGPHQWVGYAIAALLALRWIWGLVGPTEARFSAFPPSLTRALTHVREIARGERTTHRSHNPLGALMVYALWMTLAVVIGSGVAMSALPAGLPFKSEAASASSRSRPVATEDDEARESYEGEREHERREANQGEGSGAGEGDELLEEIHEVAANLLFGLAGLHLLGVAFETSRSGRGVVKAMLPGGRRRRRPA